MTRSSRPGFAKQLAFGPRLGLVGVAALLILGAVAGLYEETLYRTQKLQETSVQANILAHSVVAALVFNDRNAAQEYVGALIENPEVEAAAVYDSAGERVAGFVREGAEPSPAAMVVGPTYLAGGRAYATAPVIQNGMNVGTVYVRETTDTLQRRLVRYAAIILFVVTGVLVTLVASMAQSALSRANTELSLRASQLADANARLETEMAERAKAEAALRQSQKMEAIGQLSGGIAHDFNNLITIVKGNLQLLQRRLAQGHTEVQRYVNAASESLNRAAALTQRILAFSRQQPLSPRPVNLSGLIEGMSDLLRHSMGEDVGLEAKLKANWLALCDANQMENVVLNLAINARDAMPQGGTLLIETKFHIDSANDGLAPGDYVLLRIRDNGVGMTEDVRERAIEPFFTTKPLGRGTGLGLSVAFGYVRQSRGHFYIDSTLGRGTTVSIFLPRLQVASESLSGTG